MNQELISRPSFVDRGPSSGAQWIQDPVWATRATLGPRLDEDEHVVSRYQFAVHLGSPMPVEVYRDGKREARITRFGDLTWTPAGDSCRAIWQQPRDMGFVTFSKALVSRVADEAGAGKPPDNAMPEPGDALTRELVLAPDPAPFFGSRLSGYARQLAGDACLEVHGAREVREHCWFRPLDRQATATGH